jgi:hypothetical protein
MEETTINRMSVRTPGGVRTQAFVWWSKMPAAAVGRKYHLRVTVLMIGALG